METQNPTEVPAVTPDGTQSVPVVPENQPGPTETETLAVNEPTKSTEQVVEPISETPTPVAGQPAQYTPEMLTQLNDMLQYTGGQPAAPPEQPPQQVPVQQQQSPGQIDFVADLGQDVDLSTPENINKALNTVYNRALTDSVQRAAIVAHQYTQQQTHIKNSVDAFYTENADLAPYKAVVTQVATDLVRQNPALNNNINELFKQTEFAFRSRYGLVKKGKAPKPGTTVPKNTSTPNPAPQVKQPMSAFEEDMKDMNERLI